MRAFIITFLHWYISTHTGGQNKQRFHPRQI